MHKGIISTGYTSQSMPLMEFCQFFSFITYCDVWSRDMQWKERWHSLKRDEIASLCKTSSKHEQMVGWLCKTLLHLTRRGSGIEVYLHSKSTRPTMLQMALKTCLHLFLQWMKPLTQQWCFKRCSHEFTVWKTELKSIEKNSRFMSWELG